jgi:hypothetical protein
MDGTALLLVFINPPDEDLAGWNAWYDEEHVPNRVAVPGVLSGQRYTACWDSGPRYMAYYDLQDLDVLQSAAYKRLTTDRSDREKAELARTPKVDRRILKLVEAAAPAPADAPFRLSVAMDPPQGTEADYLAWYSEEHIPTLLQVPGWRRTRVFEQVDGNGPRYLALHELDSPAVFETEPYRKATSTPWRERVISSI